ncbi:hypothetical protein NAEGRDRAFT_58932 [Naegleria gruberi]|uniref:USP8 dimerisation domain-containing protein n=1 Tax=Naegleria gruberi TaxID=5762 RepID=D2VQF6_NAEGR|nr:uncharacterized protein NAEGRDRAFT_58932 [Naegleria gruberi]EFC40937.1 hypothetical protein NAEGRDRAFT_58932 [Naegleria gruberi]|eukprot:XP_002673681.1 hypothetical protein NAEGRDRAFT_58932 [Naegleria gruberi strain NEG-M]
MSNTPTNQRLLYSSLEDLNKAAIEQMIEIDDDTPLEIYFETAKNLLKEAKLFRESQDLEGMYKALIQYLILVVKKIPTHADFDEEAEDFEKTKTEYDYNFQKCDLVKQEIEKLRGQLSELYEVSSPVIPQPTSKPVKPVTFQIPTSNSASSSPKNDSDRRKSVIQPIMPVHETTSTLEKLPRPVSAKDLNKRFSVAVRCKDPNTLYKTPTMIAQRSKNNSRTIHYVRLLPGIIEHESPNTPNSVYHLISPKQARMMKQQISSNFSQQQYQQPMYQGNYPSYQPQSQPIYQQPPKISQQPSQPIYPQPTTYQNYEPNYSVPPQYRSFQQHYQQQYQQQHQQQQQPQYQVSTQSGNYVQNAYNNGLERVANNDQVQEYVGRQVGNLAQNEQVQRKVGSGVSNAAKNEKVQSTIGTTIASNTDNVLIQTLATNKTVQSGIGNAIANTAGNEKVQKAVGNAIHKAANDKDMQKKVAKGFLAIGKGAFSAAKTGASAGYQLYKDSEQQK